MNTSTEHILQCNQSDPLVDASVRIVDLMYENAPGWKLGSCVWRAVSSHSSHHPQDVILTQYMHKAA